MLNSPERLERLLSVAEKYMNSPISADVKDSLLSIKDQLERFNSLNKLIQENLKQGFDLEIFEIEFVVGYLYPKIDSEVSAQMNHLLKVPFNIHQDTLKLSVPIFDIKNFSPNNCVELSDFIDNHDSMENIRGASKYSFSEYMIFFEIFCRKLELDQTQ